MTNTISDPEENDALSETQLPVGNTPTVSRDATADLPGYIRIRSGGYIKRRRIASTLLTDVMLYKKIDGTGDDFVVLKKAFTPTDIKDEDRQERRQNERERNFNDAYSWHKLRGETRKGLTCILGKQYLVLPWMQGCTVQDILDDTENLPNDTALHIGYKIARKVHEMHQKNIVHCDLKPGNVMLMPNGEVELLDFNISKIRDQRLGVKNKDNRPAGTPEFMPPEQWTEFHEHNPHGPISPLTDVYAFGHSLYAMVAGKMLVNKYGLGAQADHEQGLRPSQSRPDVLLGNFVDELEKIDDPQMQTILKKMLMSWQHNRASIEEIEELLHQECLRRGIDPDGPLFRKIDVAPDASIDTHSVVEGLHDAQKQRSRLSDRREKDAA